jgi:hypothetical protein
MGRKIRSSWRLALVLVGSLGTGARAQEQKYTVPEPVALIPLFLAGLSLRRPRRSDRR